MKTQSECRPGVVVFAGITALALFAAVSCSESLKRITSDRTKTTAVMTKPAPARARVALISPKNDPDGVAALLFANLSEQDRVELVERDQLNSILREQALSAGQSSEFVKLGELVDAQGLLILGHSTNDGARFLTIRLVATGPGAVVANEGIRMPIKDTTKWASLAAARFASLAPKLMSTRESAVPISLVGISSPILSDKVYRLERQLEGMLTERLFGVPQVFVLERQRLDIAAREKLFAGGTENQFWNGAYLIEGQINRDGAALDLINLDLRLTPPGGEPRTISESGSPDNLTGIVDRLAKQIVKNTGLKDARLSWNPEAEAQRYLEETEWCLRWGLNERARVAAEAAAALGEDSPRQKTARIKCYEGLLRPSPDSLKPVDAGFYSFRVSDRPTEAQLHHAKDGLIWLLDGLREPAVATNRMFYEYGFRLLANASAVLRHFSYDRESRSAWSDELRDLRRRCREVFQQLQQNPMAKKLDINDRLAPVYPGIAPIQNMKHLAANLGRFWQDNLEANALWLTSLANSGSIDLAYVNQFLTQRPHLVCWSPEDESRQLVVWNSLLDDWSRSTNPVLRIESYSRRLREAAQEPADIRTDLKTKLLANAWAVRTNIFEGVVPARYWQIVTNELLAAFAPDPKGAGLPAFLERFDRARHQHLNDAKRLERIRAAEARRKWLHGTIAFLNRESELGTNQLRTLVPWRQYTPDEAGQVAPAMKAFGERTGWMDVSLSIYHCLLRHSAPASAPPNLTRTNITPDRIEVLIATGTSMRRRGSGYSTKPLTSNELTKITAFLTPKPGASRRPASAGPRRPGAPLPRFLRHRQPPKSPQIIAGSTTLPPTRGWTYAEAKGAPIEVNSFWDAAIEKCPAEFGRATGWIHRQTLYHNDSMWLFGVVPFQGAPGRTPNERYVGVSRAILVEAPLATLEPRFYNLPEMIAEDSSRFYSDAWKFVLAASNERVVLVSGSEIFMRPRKSGLADWQTPADQIRIGGRVWATQDRIFLTDDRTIQQLDPASSRFALVSSVRRRPPENPVDKRRYLAIAGVSEDRQGNIYFADWRGAIFRADQDLRDWSEYARDVDFTLQTVVNDLVMSSSGRTLVWRPSSRQFIVAYDDIKRRHEPRGRSKQLFAIPATSDRLVRLQARLSVNRRDGVIRVQDAAQPASRILVIDSRARKIIERPLRFSVPQKAPTLRNIPSLGGFFPHAAWTSAGVVVWIERLGGFWIIPPEELGLPGAKPSAAFVRNLDRRNAAPTTVIKERAEVPANAETRIVDLEALKKKWLPQGLKAIRRAAEDDPAVRYLLGYRLSANLNWSDFAPEEGLRHLQIAASNGIVNAQLELGHLYRKRVYRQSTGVITEYATATDWYRLAAKNGMPEAWAWIAQMIENESIPGTPQEAQEFYRQAAESGDAKGALKFAAERLESTSDRDLDAAFSWLQKAWAADRSATTVYLDRLIAGGRWPERDWSNARRFLELGANANSPQCQFQLGVLHARGMDGPADRDQAMSWFVKAHGRKHRLAAREIGKLHEAAAQSSSDTNHLAQAKQWYSQAVKTNDTWAGFRLAVMAELEQNQEAAEAWLQWAIIRGYQPAADRLAKLNPQAADEFRKQYPLRLHDHDQMIGEWRGRQPGLGLVSIWVDRAPNGNFWTLRTQWRDPINDKKHSDARGAILRLPGLSAGNLHIGETEGEDPGLVFRFRETWQSLLTRTAGATSAGLPLRDRLVGEWSGSWSSGDRFEFSISHSQYERFEVTYRYLANPKAAEFSTMKYQGTLYPHSIVPLGTNPIGIKQVSPLDGDPKSLRVFGRHNIPPTINGKRLAKEFDFIATRATFAPSSNKSDPD